MRKKAEGRNNGKVEAAFRRRDTGKPQEPKRKAQGGKEAIKSREMCKDGSKQRGVRFFFI